jgi:type IV secretion system protein VirD4
MTYTNHILLSKNQDVAFNASGYQHILLLAPHGSGKGVCFVIPCLLTLDESCIVHDIKLENYQLTSNQRLQLGHKIFLFSPLARKTHRYNPLDFISQDADQKINDLQKIADLLIQGNEIQGNESAKILFLCLALYLEAVNIKKTIGQIARLIMRPQELLEALSKIDALKNQQCAQFCSNFLSQEPAAQSQAISSLRSAIYLWLNPLVDYATSESDFDIASLKTSKTTIYVGLDPTDIERLKPLMRLFYNHAFERLMKTAQSLEVGMENGGVTVILDEFSTIGKLEKYAFAYLRGYKIRLFAISSDVLQIEDLYGKKHAASIISDCDFKVFFAAKDQKTAQVISSLCIDHSQGKELFSWQQIMALSPNLQIVLSSQAQPSISEKIKYFSDKELVQMIGLAKNGISSYNYY